MSSLIKSAKLAKFSFKHNAVLLTAIRNHWTKDYKPGPYPKTEEERRRAAERYGVHPDEYEPYPDDGLGWGDYPKLPVISADAKDPFYPYDNPSLKMNFNEPMHVDFDFMREDRYDISFRPKLPGWVLWAQFLGVMFGGFAIYYVLEQVKMFHAIKPRQYPRDGKTHYTFEPK